MVLHSLPLSLPLATFPSSVPLESQIPVLLPPSGSLCANPVPHSCSLSFPLASPRSHPPHSPVSPGEKPYVCTVPGCGKRFTEYSSLYKHHVVHTHCKPYTCSTCGKTYRQTSTLAMHKRSVHGELEATEESEQALYEQQQLEGEGCGQEVRGQARPRHDHLGAGVSPGSPLPAASAAEESPPPERPRIAYVSEVKEEGDDLPTQVAMVTEEDGAPQVALITQDGAQQVLARGRGVGGPLWLVPPPSFSGELQVLIAPSSPRFSFLPLWISRAEAEATNSLQHRPPAPPAHASHSVSGASGAQLVVSLFT